MKSKTKIVTFDSVFRVRVEPFSSDTGDWIGMKIVACSTWPAKHKGSGFLSAPDLTIREQKDEAQDLKTMRIALAEWIARRGWKGHILVELEFTGLKAEERFFCVDL